jgi:DNA-binding transcriptional ArsR family regulator
VPTARTSGEPALHFVIKGDFPVGDAAPGNQMPISGLLTKNFVKRRLEGVRDVDVIEDPRAAEVALDPIRSRLLAELVAAPASAAAVAARVGLPRQKVNYHLKTLEAHGLIELAEVRMRGGITERVLRATAASYVVSPAAIAEDGAQPEHVRDRLSARYLISLAGRVVREVGALARKADAAGRRLPTFAIDTEIRFRSAADRAAFADALTAAVLELVSQYHHDEGRPHRLVVAAHPKPAAASRGRRTSTQPTDHEENS